MNTKTTKFLAVLAVLAMAFAVFALITPAGGSDADATEATTYTVGTDNITAYESGTTVVDKSAYYIDEDVTIDVPEDTRVVLFVLKGVTVTLNCTTEGATYGYAFAAFVNVKTVTNDTVLTFDAVTLDKANWQNDASNNPITTLAGGKTWGHECHSWEKGDVYAMTANSNGTGFTMAADAEVDLDVWKAQTISGTYDKITFKANVALTCNDVTAKIITSNDELTLKNFTGSITASGSTATDANVSAWTAGDITVTKGDVTQTATSATTAGKLTIGASANYDIKAKALTVGSLVMEKNYTVNGTLAVASITDTKSSTVYGLTLGGADSTLSIAGNITLHKTLTVTSTNSAAITIAEGKKLSITVDGGATDSTISSTAPVYGIYYGVNKTLTISGKGTLEIDVKNGGSTGTPGVLESGFYTYGIGTKGPVVIKSNVTIDAVSDTTTLKKSDVGIYADNSAITFGDNDSSITAKTNTITITAGNRAVQSGHTEAAVSVYKTTLNLNAGERGIKAGSLTVTSATVNALIDNALANGIGSDEIVGAKISGEVSVSGTATLPGILNTESISSATMTIGTYGTVKVLADSATSIKTYAVGTKTSAGTEASQYAFNTASTNGAKYGWLAGSVYGIAVGTYTAGGATNSNVGFAPADISVAATGASLIIEPGCALLANVANGADTYDTAITLGHIIGTTADVNSNYLYYYALAPMTVSGSSNLVFTPGSVDVDGYVIKGVLGTDYTKDSEGNITITGTVEISGEVGVNIVLANTAKMVVPEGETLKFDSGTTITTASGGSVTATITILGDITGSVSVSRTTTASDTLKIYATNPQAASNVIDTSSDPGISIVEDKQVYLIAYSSDTILTDLTAAFNQYAYVAITTNGATADKVVSISSDFEIPAGKTLYLGVGNAIATANPTSLDVLTAGTYSVGFSIVANKELSITNSKVIDYSADKNASIAVNGSLLLNGADVCMIVDVKTDGYVSVKNPLKLEATGTPTVDLRVGYGNVLTVDSITITTGKSIYAYGTLNVTGASTIASGGKLVAYSGSEVYVAGTLNVEGVVNVAGTTEITGSVYVYRANGSAAWKDSGETVVALGALFNVSKGSNTDAAENKLEITGSFTLYGTSTITGTLVGTLIDYGVLDFNGKSTGGIIQLRQANSVTISSVTGTLRVIDTDAAVDDSKEDGAYKSYAYVYDGNYVDLTNVKGIVLTETVVESAATVSGSAVKCYVSTLTITGLTASIDKTTAHSVAVVGGSIANAPGTWPSSVSYGAAEVSDLTIGKNGTLTFSGSSYINVTGTVTVIAEGASVVFGNTGAVVTVTGVIYVNDDEGFRLLPAQFTGKVNATYLTMDDEQKNTEYYLTSFDKALAEIADADDMTIYIYGAQGAYANCEIPAGASVVNAEASAYFSIGSDATLTVNAGKAVLDGSAGTIDVAGVLVVMDKNAGIKHSTSDDRFIYQVKTENDTSVSFAGLAGALKRAIAGDVIEMSQSGKLTSNATIPEGVTLIVPSKVTLTIGSASKDVTLTVDGQLQILRNASVSKYGSKDVYIIANGSILKDSDATTSAAFEMDDYAEFTMKADGRTYTVWSNLTFASENVTSGTVYLVGTLQAGEIEFTPAKDKEIIIVIEDRLQSDKANNAVAVTEMTLNNKTTLVVSSAYDSTYYPGLFSGEIVTVSVDGPASIVFDDATGFFIQAYMEDTGKGDVYHTYMTGYFEGKIAVAEGTIEIDEFTIDGSTGGGYIANKYNGDAYFYLAPGAELIIADDAYLDVNYIDDEDPAFELDGDVYVLGTMTVDNVLYAAPGYAVVGGTLYVAKDKTGNEAVLDIYGYLDLTGDLVISGDKTLGGTVTVNGGLMSVGALETSAAPSITGPLEIKNSGLLNVYAGSDITAALINWDAATEKSKAIYTDVYVYGLPYLTAYTNSGAELDIAGDVITEDTIIIGADVKGSLTEYMEGDASLYKYWYLDVGQIVHMNVLADQVGDVAEVFFEPAAAEIPGVITIGTGISLYIDGKAYYSTFAVDDYLGVGTHTVFVEGLSGYVIDNVTIKFNGAPVTNGKITITADMLEFTLVADGATPYTPEPTPEPEKESEWTITTILLCVLVVLIAIMAVIVALRLNRN